VAIPGEHWPRTRHAALKGVMFKFPFDAACGSANEVRFYTALLGFFFPVTTNLGNYGPVSSTPPTKKVNPVIKFRCSADRTRNLIPAPKG
jgi:hypothetical protein